jgi:hypothetical protein
VAEKPNLPPLVDDSLDDSPKPTLRPLGSKAEGKEGDPDSPSQENEIGSPER